MSTRCRLAVSSVLMLAAAFVAVAPAAPGSASPASAAVAPTPKPKPDWKIQHSPNATVPGGELEAASCASAAACQAVGSYLDASAVTAPLAEAWNGTSWKQHTVHIPAGSTLTELDGVSCATASSCEAVGLYEHGSSAAEIGLAEAWNGTSWSVQSVPSPAGAADVSLSAVSCPAANLCEAVGYYENSSDSYQDLAEAWNGTAWSVQSVPSPAGASFPELTAVSCPSASFCETTGSGGSGGYADEWNGTAWTLQTVPVLSGDTSVYLAGVSCASAGFCEATGEGTNSSGDGVAAADTWNGSAWSAQSAPTPSGVVSIILSAVSCLSATSCETTGDDAGSSNVYSSLAESWNGSAWSVQSTPSPGTSYTYLNGVSCVTGGDCEAAGYDGGTSGSGQALAEAWHTGSWSTQNAVKPGGATNNYLNSVSCIAADHCVAVGSHWSVGQGPPELALAEVWDGTSWKIQATPDPKQESSEGVRGLLYGVSCVSADFCEAVGTTGTAALAEVWDGTSWKIQATPADYSYLTSVSCVSASYCEAVGSGYGGGNAMVWNGTAWTAQSTPYPGSPPSGTLEGVSCASADACEAVGNYGEEVYDLAYAEAWNGSSWSLQTVPNPAGIDFSELSGVSCPTAQACEAAGYSVNSSGTKVTLAELWNGTEWTVQTTPNPAGSVGSFLDGVSCFAAAACTAGGWYDNGSSDPPTALVWQGTTWSVQHVPAIAFGDGKINGVSCYASGACTGAGTSQDAGDYSATFAVAGD
jgi:hypothetical protein